MTPGSDRRSELARDSFISAIWFRSAIPIPNRNSNNCKPNTKPDAHAKKYLAVVRNYCSTKTTHLQAEHKYTTKANLCIPVETSDHSVFRYNVI